MNKAGIYLHIPFCKTKCIYCDFYSVTKRDDSISKFIDCLYLARNIHSDIDHPTTFKWITGENWHLSYTELIKSLSIVLSNNDGLSLIESNSKVKLEVDKLISPAFYPRTSIRQLIREKILKN